MTAPVGLLCPGRLLNHGNGTYQCSTVDCPGEEASHPWYSSCDCPEHTTAGPFDCYPARAAA